MMNYTDDFLHCTSQLDVIAFWEENEKCLIPSMDKPRCALEFSPDDHWLFEFIQPISILRYYQEKEYRDGVHQQANELLLRFVGKSFFDEDAWQYQPRRIENLFDCEFTYTNNSTPWLTPATDDPDEFAKILDRAEKTDITQWAFPDEFLREWEARKKAGKTLPLLGTGSRGPATIMTSVLPVETVFYWIYDHPQLMQQFRDILKQKMVELNCALREFSCNTEPGWWITDDNSALFNKKLYREYCFPVLEQVLNEFASGDSRRYQHSDSSMGHIIDQQRELGINAVNYGPEVDAALIREKLPHAVIHGQIPPFLLRNGTPEEIRQRIRDDFEKAGATGRQIITTAGSLAAGTNLGRMRWMMQCVLEDCQY
jgi:uroporphyrinogen decarboxylase